MRDKKHRRLQPFIEMPEGWEEAWEGMPEYVQEDLNSYAVIKIHFDTKEDMNAFAKLVSQEITRQTQSIWYPKAKIGKIANKRYVTEKYNK